MCDVHAAERKRDPERERIYSAILIFHAVFETNLKVFFFGTNYIGITVVLSNNIVCAAYESRRDAVCV